MCNTKHAAEQAKSSLDRASETPATITIGPDYEGMRLWLKNVAKTDLPTAVRINASLHCEGIDWDELVDLYEGVKS